MAMYYESILLHEAIRLLLISIRQQRSHTQRSLSIESGISRQFISQMECGKKQPSLDTLSQLALALQTNMSSLMEELDRIYQHLLWQRYPRQGRNSSENHARTAAENTSPNLNYIRKARGLRRP